MWQNFSFKGNESDVSTEIPIIKQQNISTKAGEMKWKYIRKKEKAMMLWRKRISKEKVKME